MDKTITVGQKWLVNELVLSFWALKKSAKAQSNLSNLMILSNVIAVTDNDNDNDSKRGNFMKTEGVKFYTNLISANTFSDENI